MHFWTITVREKLLTLQVLVNVSLTFMAFQNLKYFN